MATIFGLFDFMESNNHIITFVLNKVVSAKYRLPFLFMGM